MFFFTLRIVLGDPQHDLISLLGAFVGQRSGHRAEKLVLDVRHDQAKNPACSVSHQASAGIGDVPQAFRLFTDPGLGRDADAAVIVQRARYRRVRQT
ncbi:hypothetical protein D3C87_1409630 [compost metagenome]